MGPVRTHRTACYETFSVDFPKVLIVFVVGQHPPVTGGIIPLAYDIVRSRSGADVIFDRNLHPFLLEFNKGPDMSAKSTEDRVIKKKVNHDIFELVGLFEPGQDSNGFYKIW